MSTPESKPAQASAFAPLRGRVFAVLWAATIIGNVGSFMRDVASAWLVTDLSGAPAAVALVQAAATLPIFLLAIPAGVLSDILDRRKFLIAIQFLLGLVSLSLMLLSTAGLLSVSSLVALTFLAGIGAALMAPTWQAIVPELVEKPDLKSAVALNSLGVNISRAIGPALGGLILATLGAGFTYGADVLSYVVVIAALIWWRRAPQADDALSERFTGAFIAGLRYARASRELHVVLLRAAVFFACASAVWALLPLVARNLLGGGAGFYGILLGAVGAGAILGALLLPRLRARFDADGLLLLAGIVTAAVMATLALAPPQGIAVAILMLLGAAWIIALTTLNGVAQSILPNWVRGRALAVYLTVFNGAMTAGSLSWGAVAEAAGLRGTLVIAAGGLLVAAIVMHRVRLPAGEADLAPSNHWPEPLVASSVAPDRGPVLILIEYRVQATDRDAFVRAVHRLAVARRRDGAHDWASPRTPPTRRSWSSGSSSRPGPSICASTNGCRKPMPSCSSRSGASISAMPRPSCAISSICARRPRDGEIPCISLPSQPKETTMSGYLEVLTPQNSQMIFIDQQPQMAFGVQSIDRQALKNNVVGLAKAAKVFGIPTTITTVETTSFSGHTYPELLAVFPESKILERTSMNSWDDQNVRDALAANSRRKVVVSGLWTEVCNTTFALCAMLEGGYEIYMVADASGGTSADAHKYAMDRMVQAGVVPVTWQQVLLEWQRDWARRDTYDAVVAIAKEHSGAYGMGIDYAYTMVHGAPERVAHGERVGPNPAMVA